MEKPALRTLEQISAGGVAFRRLSSKIEIAVVLTNFAGRWQLPKGLIDDGETSEQAAVREVREEAGLETEIIEPLETVEYWYVGKWNGERVRFHKFVHFFLLKYIAGEVADHDHEVLEARWVGPDEAIEMLSFQSEKDVVQKAFNLISVR